MHTPVNACVLQETVNRATFKGSSEDAPDQDAEEAAEPAPKPAKKARTQKAEKDTEPKQSKNKKKGGVNLMSKAKSVIAACAPLQITLNHTLDSLTPDLRTKLPGYMLSDASTVRQNAATINAAWQDVLQGNELLDMPMVQFENAMQTIKQGNTTSKNLQTMLSIVKNME